MSALSADDPAGLLSTLSQRAPLVLALARQRADRSGCGAVTVDATEIVQPAAGEFRPRRDDASARLFYAAAAAVSRTRPDFTVSLAFTAAHAVAGPGRSGRRSSGWRSVA